MAVDGNLYVLFADGQVKKFLDGQPQDFSMQGLPTPMNSPTTIFVSGEQSPTAAGHVYVTDTGNERIVEFDKQGNYVRQFQDAADGTHLRNLRGVYVNEERGQLFILSGRDLWLTEITSLVPAQAAEV
jgi:sugar lactone lactonase YvrE